MNPMTPSAGQLASTFALNPQGLQALAQQKMVQPGGGMPPSMPPTYLDAIAMQQVQEQAAQISQALQAKAQQGPGGPPTVFDQTKQQATQLTAQNMAQQQPQAQPGVAPPMTPQGIASTPAGMAAGGSVRRGINEVPSNLKLAGGGIIAFDEGGDVGDATDENLPLRVKPSIIEALKNLPAWLWKHEPPSKMKQASYSNEGRNAAPPEPTLGSTQDPGPSGFAQLRAAAAAGDPDAIKALALFSAKYPESANAAQPSAPRESSGPYNAPSSGERGAPAPQGIAALAAPRENEFASKVQKALLEGMDTDPRAARDRDASYAKEGLGLEGILAEKRRLADAQEAMQEKEKGSRLSPREAMYAAMLAQPNSFNQGPADIAAGMGRGILGGKATMQGYAADDTQKAEKIRALREGILSDQFTGNKIGVEAGLKGQESAERTKSSALGNAVNESTRMEASRARTQIAEIAQQTRADAKDAGADNKMLALMAASQRNAMDSAVRMAAEAAKNPMKGMDVDVPSLTVELYNKALNNDAVYQDTMRKLGIQPTKTTAPSTAGWSAKIKP